MRVQHFADYHEIPGARRKGEYAIELGCWPAKGYPYFRYFALFSRGQLPNPETVLTRVEPKVTVPFTFGAGPLKGQIVDQFTVLNDIKESLDSYVKEPLWRIR